MKPLFIYYVHYYILSCCQYIDFTHACFDSCIDELLTMEIVETTVINVKPINGNDDSFSAVTEETRSMAQMGNSEVQSAAPPSDDVNAIETMSSPQLDTEEVTRTLEWFRVTFTRIGKHDRVTLKEFKYAARDLEVSIAICNTVIVMIAQTPHTLQGFADNLFKLFDTDCSESVSLQELVGGLGRLTA